MTEDDAMENPLEKDLTSLLNKHNVESNSDTPDFVLARYLLSCLAAFNYAIASRGAGCEPETKECKHLRYVKWFPETVPVTNHGKPIGDSRTISFTGCLNCGKVFVENYGD